MIKIETYLGFAIKSGTAVYGVDNIEKSCKRVKVILSDVTLAENSFKRLMLYAERKRVPMYHVKNLPELLHKPNTLAIAVTNKELSAAILSECKKENWNECGKSE